jgi:hypothetical protein
MIPGPIALIWIIFESQIISDIYYSIKELRMNSKPAIRFQA